MAEMQTQAIEDLTSKESSAISNNDTLLVINSSEGGYQATTQNLGDHMIQNARSNLNGKTQTVAAAIGEVNGKLPSNNGTNDQILRSNGDGTSRWDNAASASEIGAAVTEWLEENIAGGQTIAIDDSLTVEDAAADAKAVGDVLDKLKSDLKRYNFALFCSGNAEIEIDYNLKTIYCNFDGFIFDANSYYNVRNIAIEQKTIDFSNFSSAIYIIYFNNDTKRFEAALSKNTITASKFVIVAIYWFSTLTDIKRVWEYPMNDNTLKSKGKYADAKAVGDAISAVNDDVEQLQADVADMVDNTLSISGKAADAYETGVKINALKYINNEKLDYGVFNFVANKKIYNRDISAYSGNAGTGKGFKGFATRINAQGINKICGVKINRIAIYSNEINHDASVTFVIMDDNRNIIESRELEIPYNECNTRNRDYDIPISTDLTNYDNVYIGIYANLNDDLLSINSIEAETQDLYCTADDNHKNLYAVKGSDIAWKTANLTRGYAISCAFILDSICTLTTRTNNLKYALWLTKGGLKADPVSKTLGFTENALLFYSGYPSFRSVSEATVIDISSLSHNSVHEFGMRENSIFYVGLTDNNYAWKENEVFLCRLWIDGDFQSLKIISFINENNIIDSKTIDTTPKIIMPNTMYGLSGDNVYMYIENAILNPSRLNNFNFYGVRTDGNIKNITNLEYTKMPRIVLSYTGNTNVELVLKTYPDLKKYSKKFIVKTANKRAGISCNLLVIADSFRMYRYGNGILKYIQDFAATDGMTINMIGTHITKYGVASEARGGWTESDYYTHYVPIAQRDPEADTEDKKVPSPFVFSDDDTVEHSYFSFKKYITDNNITVPDIIMIALGMNYDAHEGAYINAMIDDIREDYPNVKIIINTIAACPKNGSGKYYTEKESREKQNISYISLFDNRENENIFICPEHLALDGSVGIQGEIVNANPVSLVEGDKIEEWYNTGIHPTAMGAWCIAKMNYETIAYVMLQ